MDVLLQGGTRRTYLVVLVLLLVALVLGGALLVGGQWLRRPPPLGVEGGRLAYAKDDSVFIADSDGSHPVRIAGPGLNVPLSCSAYFEGTPWSPDGRYLAYRAFGGDCPAPAVDVVDLSGRVVSSFPGSGWTIGWSPDSTRLVTSDVAGPDSMSVYGLDGGRLAQLRLPTGYHVYGDYDPRWSPDGAFVTIPLRPDPGGDPFQIWELPLDGSPPRAASDTEPWAHAQGTWTHAGDRFAFSPTLDPLSLVVTKADGTILRRLAPPPQPPAGSNSVPRFYQDPALSPSGDRVAYVYPISDSQWELRVTDVATGETRTLVSGPSISRIQFAPDETQLLYEVFDGSDYSLWSVNADGSDNRPVIPLGSGYWQPPAAPTP